MTQLVPSSGDMALLQQPLPGQRCTQHRARSASASRSRPRSLRLVAALLALHCAPKHGKVPPC